MWTYCTKILREVQDDRKQKMLSNQYLKELGNYFKSITEKLQEELRAVRGSRPSVDLLEGIKVNYYDQDLPINQLGSLSVMPPRSVQISVWDKNAVGAVTKAIEAAKRGFSVSSDGNNVIATISPLISERREELSRFVKKTSEGFRIQVRASRDEVIKKLKEAEGKKEMSEDEVFKAKEKVQKLVDETNKKIEEMVEGKLKELSE